MDMVSPDYYAQSPANDYVAVTAPIAYIHWLHGHKIAIQIDGSDYLTVLRRRGNCEQTGRDFLSLIAKASNGKGIRQFSVWVNDYFLVPEEQITLMMLWRCYNTSIIESAKN